MTAHALDLTVFCLIFASILAAALRGIIREFFTLAGFLLALLAAWKVGPILMPMAQDWTGVPPEGSDQAMPVFLGLLDAKMAARLISYGGVFTIVAVFMAVLRMTVSRWIKESGLTIIDRILGAIFGFLRGFVLAFAIYAVCFYLVPANIMPGWVNDSKTASIMGKTLAWAEEHFEFKKFIEDRGKNIAITFDKVGAGKDSEKDGDKDESKDGAKGDEALSPSETTTPEPAAPTYTPVPEPQQAPPLRPPEGGAL